MSVSYMSICPKCANFKMMSNCCGGNVIKTDTTFEEAMRLSDKQEEDLINHYIETLIKDTYDPKAREEREANEKHPFDGYVSDDSPKCPTCQSTNIKKMGGIERGASIYAFGIFSKKINKTFKCKNCGYTW